MVTVHDIGLFSNFLRVQHHFDFQFVDDACSRVVSCSFSCTGHPTVIITPVNAGRRVDFRLSVFLVRKSLRVLFEFVLFGFEAIFQRLALRLPLLFDGLERQLLCVERLLQGRLQVGGDRRVCRGGNDFVQINAVVTGYGEKSLDDLFPKEKPEVKKE